MLVHFRDDTTLKMLNEWMAKRAQGLTDFTSDSNIDWDNVKPGDEVHPLQTRPLAHAIVFPLSWCRCHSIPSGREWWAGGGQERGAGG